MSSGRAPVVPEAAGLLGSSTRWLFLLAHPGHELRAFHAVERVSPVVCLLTDGSGSTDSPRTADSLALVAQAGGRVGPVAGALTDRQAYAALMARDAAPFAAVLDAMADLIVSERVQAVLVDAAEGYNPVHDVCHWLGRAAVTRAREYGCDAALFEVDLVGRPDPGTPGRGLRLELDAAAFERKLAATREYAALKAEVDWAFERYGRDAFRVEFLRRVDEDTAPPPYWVPYYEEVGNARVKEGRYTSVLRYSGHVRPVIERLLESARAVQYATDLGTADE